MRLIRAVVLCAFLVASCTRADTGATSTTTAPTMAPIATTAPTEPPVELKPYGGTVIWVDGGDPLANPEEYAQSFNPVGFVANGEGWHVRRWQGDRYVPGLLSEVPTEANGGLRFHDDGTMTVRYEIHPDAVWEDGTPITGEDFRFTYDFIMANFDELAAIAAESGFDPNWKRELPNIDVASFVVEDQAFSYTLPATRFWGDLFDTVVPKHQVVATDLEPWLETPTNWYSSSAWQPDYLIPVAVGPSGWPEAVQRRNDRYWVTDDETGQQLPYWDEVRFVYLPDDDEAWEYFLTTPEADTMFHLVSNETISDIDANDLIVILMGGTFEHIGFNFGPSRFDANPGSLVDHLPFRQAVAHALDRDRIASEVYGGLIDTIDSYVSVFSPSLSTNAWSRYDFDPEQARSLLGELCAELGRDCVAEPPSLVFSTTGWNPVRARTAELVREMLGEVGIAVTLDVDHDWFSEILDTGHEAVMVAWQETPDLNSLVGLHLGFGPDATFPIYSWGTEESTVRNETTERFAEIYAQMQGTFDDDQLVPLINEAEQILADELVFIPLFPQGWAQFWKPDRFVGVEAKVATTAYYGDLEGAYRTDLGDAARHEP
ncbi:MAG: ABC transporter substrate-binding protein [Acidimicrobiia bacterium]|nr:ABC transporter substrate-binding protein [Acidimicrobiia bacterium]